MKYWYPYCPYRSSLLYNVCLWTVSFLSPLTHPGGWRVHFLMCLCLCARVLASRDLPSPYSSFSSALLTHLLANIPGSSAEPQLFSVVCLGWHVSLFSMTPVRKKAAWMLLDSSFLHQLCWGASGSCAVAVWWGSSVDQCDSSHHCLGDIYARAQWISCFFY